MVGLHAMIRPSQRSRAAPAVIIHGWQGSEPEHWQTWLVGELRDVGREVRYPQLPDPDEPLLSPWLDALHFTLDGLPYGGFDLICHSLGALLWLHHVETADRSPRPARVALVAPPSPRTAIPQLTGFLPVALDAGAVRQAADGIVLVCGDDDPYCPEGAAGAYGLPLKLPTTVIRGGGHLNVASGYGPWPAMLDWCSRDNLAFIG
jgi:predicted alpha/beta hydrolase family esterase